MATRDPKRNTFTLPALTLPTSSLTDGTSIPPPAREPTPPPPSTTPTPRPGLARQNTNPLSSHPPNADGTDTNALGSHANGTATPAANGLSVNTNGVGRVQSPVNGTGGGLLSPTSPASRDGSANSVRKFLSRQSLNTAYKSPTGLSASASLASINATKSGQPGALPKHLDIPGRPESSLSFVSVGGTKTKRKRSWWARLFKGEEKEVEERKRKRGSVIQERDEEEEEQGRRGPPPPMLPELRGLSREGQKDGLDEDMFSNIR